MSRKFKDVWLRTGLIFQNCARESSGPFERENRLTNHAPQANRRTGLQSHRRAIPRVGQRRASRGARPVHRVLARKTAAGCGSARARQRRGPPHDAATGREVQSHRGGYLGPADYAGKAERPGSQIHSGRHDATGIPARQFRRGDGVLFHQPRPARGAFPTVGGDRAVAAPRRAVRGGAERACRRSRLRRRLAGRAHVLERLGQRDEPATCHGSRIAYPQRQRGDCGGGRPAGDFPLDRRAERAAAAAP